MKDLTEKQRAILDFLARYLSEYRRQPNLGDFAREFGITREGVRRHLLAIEKKGFITYSGQGPRGIIF